MKKRHIALLIPNLEGGGAERVVSYLTQHLQSEKYNKYVILFDGSRVEYPCDAQIIDMKSRLRRGTLSRTFKTLKRARQLKKIKKKLKLDTTVSFMGAANIANLLSPAGDQRIISVRNYQSRELLSPHIPFLVRQAGKMKIRRLYSQAEKIVALSKGVGWDLANNYSVKEKKITVIYNPCDVDKIECLSRKDVETPYSEIFQSPTVITAGRLTFQKGQWHLMRAFRSVIDQVPDARLIILGRGELEGYLRELASGLRIDGNTHFLGFQNNPFKFFARAEIFVLTSLYEGFGNVITEAMACGTPVISSDCAAGPREILAPHTDALSRTAEVEYAEHGVLAPVCDGIKYGAKDALTREESRLAEGITVLLKDDAKHDYYRQRGRERADDFKVGSIIKQWEEIL